MKDRREIVAVKSFVERELLERPNVTGVDVDYKTVDGKQTNELALVVWVREKTDDVPEEELIPPKLHGVQTDVIEGEFFPSLPKVKVAKAKAKTKAKKAKVKSEAILAQAPENVTDDIANPLVGGVSVGPCDVNGYGTLGVTIVYQGLHMILSNLHVLAPSLNPQGALITQPGNSMGGNCPTTLAGTFHSGFLGQPSNVDAALAVIQNRFAVQGRILLIGQITGTDVTFPGDNVAKYGATSQFTTGRVASDTFTVRINYPTFGPQIFYNQLRIVNDVQGQSFQSPGDSGAILLNEDREAVGLMYGRHDSSTSQGQGLANPIQDVMRAFHMNSLP